MRGTASEVGGIVSATRSRNTVSDRRIVTPTCIVYEHKTDINAGYKLKVNN